MKTNWQTKKLGEVCEIEYGTRIVKSRNIPGVYDVYGGGGKTFTTNSWNRENCMIVSRFGMSEKCVRRVNDKFFLNDSGLSVSPKNNSELLGGYLDLFLYASQTEIYSLGRGQAQKNLDVEGFKKLEIPLPPLDEQKKIIKMLDEKMGKITEAKRLRAEALADTEKILSQTLYEIFEEGKRNGWMNLTLKDVAEFENGDRGKDYPNKSHRTEKGIPFINAGHITENGLDMNSMDYIPVDRFSMLRAGKIKAGDILFCLRGSLGKVTDVGDLKIGAIASSLVIIRPNEIVLKDFLLYYLKSNYCKKQVQQYQNGAAQPNLSVRSLKEFIIFLPPFAEQQKIVTKLDTLSEKLRTLRDLQIAQLADFKSLERAYLREAFNK